MRSSKEKSTPRDKDKLIRQLSLVTFLMSKRGRPVKADDIRRYVEGYDDGSKSLEAFTRRFYADRDELARTGIEIESSRDESGDGDTYRLPPENLFLPPVPFSREELAALHTCLYLLEGRFAYSRLLRQALQSLALGAGNTLDDPVTGSVAIDLPSAGFDAEVAKRQQKIDRAIEDRKTIRFTYHSFGSDRVEERLVDPYRMIYTHGDWYLVGYSHEREDIRMFKLRRIRGRITYLDKREHHFEAPGDFHLHDYLDLEPWQLGTERGAAELRFSPRYGWWAQNNLARSGEIEMHSDGSATYRTSYSNGNRICALVLARSNDTRLAGPPELKQQLAATLEKIAALHEGDAPEPAPALDPQPQGQSLSEQEAAGQPQVEPERFSQLAKTVTYLEARLDGEEFVTLTVDEVCRDLGLGRNELEQAMAMLYLVSAESGGYLVNGVIDGDSLRVEGFPHGELLKKPLRLTPREARAMLLAIDLVGGQILAGQNQSLETAREKIIAAAGGLDHVDAIPIGESDKEDHDICRALNRGLAEHRLVEIEYLARSGGDIEKRIIEPYLVSGARGQWYLVAWCRARDGVRTFRFDMVKSARFLDEAFEPRDIDLNVYRNDPNLLSGGSTPGLAQVLFSPAVARWVHEMQPGTLILEEGSALGGIQWFSEDWIIDETLRYCGEAVVIAPADLREKIRAAALRLAGEYS